ncbi:MAG: hypothetical protein KBT32_11635 [Bacteroidales bacterium]|nr:hypothetical protein [Candidatus Physcocola equi]
MKKLILTYCICLLSIVQCFAQRGWQGMLDLGVGSHAMKYDPNTGSSKPSIGGKIGTTDSYFITNHIGFGLGLYLNYHQTRYSFRDSHQSDILTDSLNKFTYLLKSSLSIEETQRLLTADLPVSFRTKFSLNNDWELCANLGLAVGLPIWKKYETTEKQNTTAHYIEPNIDFHDMPNHGFSTGNGSKEGDFWMRKMNIAPFIEVGLSKAMSSKHSLYMGLYYSYGISNLLKGNRNDEIELGNTTKGSTALASNVTDKLTLSTIGLNVGIIFNGKDKDSKPKKETTKKKTKSIVDSLLSKDTTAKSDTIIIARTDTIGTEKNTSLDNSTDYSKTINTQSSDSSFHNREESISSEIKDDNVTEDLTDSITSHEGIKKEMPPIDTIKSDTTAVSVETNSLNNEAISTVVENSTVSSPEKDNAETSQKDIDKQTGKEETKDPSEQVEDTVQLHKSEEEHTSAKEKQEVQSQPAEEISPVKENTSAKKTEKQKENKETAKETPKSAIKIIRLHCTHGQKATLRFNIPLNGTLSQENIKKLKQIANTMAEFPMEKVVLTSDGKIVANEITLLLKIKRELISYGVKPAQIIFGLKSNK